jgi:hypothetical protein
VYRTRPLDAPGAWRRARDPDGGDALRPSAGSR